MKNCGFDPKEYSCIYNLVKNEGSKMSKVFSENEMGDTILFDGTCSETYSMRANRETKQFRATISRLKRQSNETLLSSSEFIDRSEMHFLTEKERRQLAFNQNMERQQVRLFLLLHAVADERARQVPLQGEREEAVREEGGQ